jgi:hypothetical protein
MSNKDWKDIRIEDINKKIEATPDKYAKENLVDYYVDEYSEILKSEAKSYHEFKKERGEI